MGLAASGQGLVAATSPRPTRRAARAALKEILGNQGHPGENDYIRVTVAELERYFKGESPVDFARVSLDMEQGTPFQQHVWQELRRIPYGETRTYGALARACGRPNAARAVGQCNARNPWAILVPCHRVIGANAGLTGYAGGLDMKRRLIELERLTVTAPNAKELSAAPQRREIHAYRD